MLLARPDPAQAGCTASVTNATFASLNVLSSGVGTTTATLSFSCTGMTPAVPISLCPNLDGGSGGGDGSGGRLLASGAATVPFQIYQDSGYSQPWGSSSLLIFGSVPTITVTPDIHGAASTTKTLYAQVSAPQTAAPGTYTSSFTGESFFYGLNLLSCAGVTVGTAVTPATFTFSVTISSNCSVSATNMAFNTSGILSTALAAQNQFSVQCTATTPYTLSLNNGLYGSSPGARQMASGTNRITYAIYKDAGRSQLWGDISQGASYAQSSTGTGAAQSFTGYGQVPVQTTPAPGAYSDTVIATLAY
jgi:spore coat protein U-like protein